MTLLEHPLRTAEFLAVDVETNGRAGDACEVTEVGAVVVGGGELHERFDSLMRVRSPLTPGIQRFTGITQAMVVEAAAPRDVLAQLGRHLSGRILVAHSAAFDRRALAQAFARAGLRWPEPPALCTVALARRFAPLVRQRKLGALAAALGIDVAVAHRALADAETCARVFCALFPRLCAHAVTVQDALALFPRRRRRPRRGPPPGRLEAGDAAPPCLDFSSLPDGPGVYVFRDARGRPLYVGKSVSMRARARSHFSPAGRRAGWTAHAALVDHEATNSELGALVLENRMIKALRPPGNERLRRVDSLVYLRCRLDIAFPVLEVAREPAPGHGVTVGPLRGRAPAAELVEQLNSLFGLRHCGRRLYRREHPSAYGQMGRCLSPCLGDLDPNLYRRRLDAALAMFDGPGDGGAALLDHLDAQMRTAASELQFERAAGLRRRRRRLEVLLRRLGGVLRATHARPRLVLAAAPAGDRFDAFWVVEGRLADWGALPGLDELARRTAAVLPARRRPGTGAHLPAEEIDEVRIIAGWLARHPEAHALALDEALDPRRLAALVQGARGATAAAADGSTGGAAERQLDDLGARVALADRDGVAGLGLTAHEREADGAERGGDDRAAHRADLALPESQALAAGGRRGEA
jgi:DNA polymerase-3 subunit epsilon